MRGHNIDLLLIDDDEDDRLIFHEMLSEDQRTHFEVDEAETLADGISRVQSKYFDAVLLDLNLPDSRGISTFEELRNIIPGLPIVVLTGQYDEELGLSAVQEGAQDYLIKGEVNDDLLARSVRYAIGRKSAEKHLDLERRVLKLLSSVPLDDETLTEALNEIHDNLPIAAVGLRLHRTDNWPFVASVGIPEDCLSDANDLLVRDEEGRVVTDKNGDPLLRCLCGMVISGKIPPGLGHTSERGSFWTNDASGTMDELSRHVNEDAQRNCFPPCCSQSIALVPVSGNSNVVGLLYFCLRPTHTCDRALIEFLEELADSIGIALARQRLTDQLRTYTERLEGLRRVDEAILAAGSLDDIAVAALRHVHNLVPCHSASVMEFDREQGKGKILGYYDYDDDRDWPAPEVFPSIIHQKSVLAQGEPVIVPNTAESDLPEQLEETLSNGDLQSYVSIPLRHSEKLIGALNLGWRHPRRIPEDDLDIATELADVLAIAIGQSRERQRREKAEKTLSAMDYEMRVARTIQQRFYPDHAPQVASFEIAGLCRPAELAGGDYYDFLVLPDETVVVLIGDVVGHGVGAAVLMAAIRSYMHAFSRTYSDIVQILDNVNVLVARQTPSNMFCSLSVLHLIPGEPTMRYINAGHPTGYVMSAGGTTKVSLKSTTFPLGLLEDAEFPYGPEVHLESGDVVSLFTDGITDATSDAGQYFRGRAESLVRDNTARPALDIAKTIFEEVDRWCAPDEPHDDITTVIVKATDLPSVGSDETQKTIGC